MSTTDKFRRIAEIERKLRLGAWSDGISFEDRQSAALWMMEESVGGNPDVPKLTPRWTYLRPHPIQRRLWTEPIRFKCVPAGRRSGKTEIGKRHLVRAALSMPMGCAATRRVRFLAGAPVQEQAMSLFWEDLKALIPDEFIQEISESGWIQLVNGAELQVFGFDKPQRAEGAPINGLVLDEYADMHEKVWRLHIRPALADSLGWCWFTGVPEGRNHYYDLISKNIWEQQLPGWQWYTWWSSDILPQDEVDDARRTMDEISFRQEFQAEFLLPSSMAYYAFDRKIHVVSDVDYHPELPLIVCKDFNSEPGTASIVQEIEGRTVILDEVYIPKNSNTLRVSKVIVDRYGEHPSQVKVYGDATGGAKGSAKVQGSDWELSQSVFRPHFGDRVSYHVPKANPPEIVRRNSVNTRLRNAAGDVNCLVHRRCVNMIRDFEGVQLKEGTNEIDKSAKLLTHLSDGFGYYIHKVFPIAGGKVVRAEASGY